MNIRSLACFSIALLAAQSSIAASVIYSDRSTWLAATAPVATVGFEGIAPLNSYSVVGTSATIEGVNFTASQSLIVISADYAEGGGKFCFGTGACLFSYANGISGLPGSVTSVGFDLRGYLEGSTTFDITLSNGDIFTTTVANPAGGFWGVTTDSAFTSVLIDTRTDYGAIDNFSYGGRSAPASVPEPGSLALLGLGVVGLAASRRRKP